MNMENAKEIHGNVKDRVFAEHPALQLDTLLQKGMDLLLGNTTVEELLKEYGPEVRDAAVAYVKGFSFDFLKEGIREAMGKLKDDDLRELAEGDFAEKLAGTVVSIGGIVASFCRNDMTREAMMEALGKCGAKDIGLTLLKAKGIDLQAILAYKNMLMTAGASAVAYAALTEAYTILMDTLADAELAHEEMLRIKAECDANAALIRQYRLEMEETVTAFFERHYDHIEAGMAAMDRALLERDSNGYLQGNAELLQLLGHEIQFSNQEEFDDFMDSDMDFKL